MVWFGAISERALLEFRDCIHIMSAMKRKDEKENQDGNETGNGKEINTL
jgi:hypothetical protein